MLVFQFAMLVITRECFAIFPGEAPEFSDSPDEKTNGCSSVIPDPHRSELVIITPEKQQTISGGTVYKCISRNWQTNKHKQTLPISRDTHTISGSSQGTGWYVAILPDRRAWERLWRTTPRNSGNF